MDEIYVTYVDDEHADNHDHDDYFYWGVGGDRGVGGDWLSPLGEL